MAAPNYKPLARAALDVARQRAARLDEIRRALLEGDEARALRLMRIHTGIEEEDGEGDRPDPRLH